jgi:hypothetical protein
VGIVCGVFATIGFVGVFADGAAGWGLMVRAPLAAVAPIFDLRMPLFIPERVLYHAYGLNYAALGAVIALFLLTPRLPWRIRFRAVLLDGIPTVYLVQVATGAILLAIAGTLGSTDPLSPSAVGTAGWINSFMSSVFLAFHIGVPVLAWHRWVCRLEAPKGGRRPRSIRAERGPQARRKRR